MIDAPEIFLHLRNIRDDAMAFQNPLHLRRLMRQTIKDVSIRFFRTSSFFSLLNPRYFNKLLLHCLKNGESTKKDCTIRHSLYGVLEGIRTLDRPLRRRELYPAELPGHVQIYLYQNRAFFSRLIAKPLGIDSFICNLQNHIATITPITVISEASWV